MCDTLYFSSETVKVFMKNSDRAANEPNLILAKDAREKGGGLQCTYISIPDEGACGCILYKPSWIWGAEMGVNEYGVAIGNEAVFTKGRGKKKPSLIGMDFLRLSLERAKTAKEGADIIIDLLRKYGQGGNCGFDHSFYYDNSYLISDYNNAYILETAGREWALKHIESGNISNRLSLGAGYGKSSVKGDFAKAYTNKLITFFSGSKDRQAAGARGLSCLKDNPSVENCFKILRGHEDTDIFEKGSVKSLCMHAGAMLGDHTTGSMVAYTKDSVTTLWLTGSSTPCLSVFKPVYFKSPSAPVFTDENESLSYWQTRETLNRAIYAGVINVEKYKEKTAALELEFIKGDLLLRKRLAADSEYAAFSKECAEKERELIDWFLANVGDFSDKLPKHWRKRESFRK